MTPPIANMADEWAENNHNKREDEEEDREPPIGCVTLVVIGFILYFLF